MAQSPPEDNEADWIPLITGSSAEFYIEPILPHVGDIDLMYHSNTELAIPPGDPPPTQLPAEFHDYVQVLEIIDSDFPGYVYLVLRYLLTQCTDTGRYNAVEYDGQRYACIRYRRGTEVHGPAIVHILETESADEVFCVRCLSWPSQAADWPTRHRNYGWPDSATVGRVASNGCDVVQVAHRQCRQDEWMRKYQWRLSFSRAEIVLLNSWMPVQQIVYHMLRVFVKIERLTNSADNSGAGTLSNYHIKTLMLWACELKPRSWWTDDLNVVRICVELLNNLAVWLTEARCQHYFINKCNLLDSSFNMEIASRLLLIDKSWLSLWFVNNYVRKSSQSCPESVSRLFDDVSTSMKLENAVSAVVQWRLNTATVDMWRVVELAKFIIAGGVSRFSLTVRSCNYWLTELSKIHLCLPVYFTAFVFLHISRRIERNTISENLVKVLATAVNHSVASSDYYNELNNGFIYNCQQLATNSTEVNTSELIELLQQSAVEQLTTFLQLEARDFGSVGLIPIFTTDFEALYAYKHGNYQQCLELIPQHNVRTMLRAIQSPSNVWTFPEFIRLLDDDIVSLTALTLIVNCSRSATVTQLTLSLYLMTQCQLKLRHPVTSLAQTLDYIEVARRRHRVDRTLDQLTLKLIERKILTYIASET